MFGRCFAWGTLLIFGVLPFLGLNVFSQFVETGRPPGFVTKWGSYGSYGSAAGLFSFPRDLAVDGSGNVYVTDTENDRIQKFDSFGDFITMWGIGGGGDGQFTRPYGVAADLHGNVYVADTFNDRIQKFDSTGSFITKWGSSGTGNGQFDRPYSLAVDKYGNVYVAELGNDRIQKFDSSGDFITKWGSGGSGNGQFSNPYSVAADSFGNVYVADTHNSRIQKFDSFGVFLVSWGAYGTGDGQFREARALTVDDFGNVYVADSNNDRIQKFDRAGNFIAKWGSLGSGDGQFDFPHGIAVDHGGNVFVSDNQNHRVQKFAPSVQFRVEGEDARLNVNRVSAAPANRVVMELKNNGSSFFKFTNTFNGQQWTLNPLGNSFTFDNLNFPGQEFRLYNSGRLVITPSSLGTTSFDLLANGDLTIAGTMTATDYSYTSDRNRKTDFGEVNVAEVLEKVSALPVTRWRFKGTETTHIGPMGQDFHALFGVGRDERHLSPADTAGAVLAAVQGLHQQLKQKEAELLAEKLRDKKQQEEINALKMALEEIQSRLKDY